MAFIIDAHEDMAYNFWENNRDYRQSAAEIRAHEEGSLIPRHNGQTLLGWEDYQRGQVAVIFSTLFITPSKYCAYENEKVVYKNPGEAKRWFRAELDHYELLQEDSPEKFRIIKNRRELKAVITPWDSGPANLPTNPHPIGLVVLMEGVEAIGKIGEMQDWWEYGVRIAGPVWAGTRFCGGTIENGGFTREGFELLDLMAELGFTLDLAHMTEKSCLQALDHYPGAIIASHANVRPLIKGVQGERHLTETVIHKLIERDGIIGVMPYNRFLKSDWKDTDNRTSVTLENLVAHIDYICQRAGDTNHVGIGSDFDGGFGYPSVPYEINTIADLQKITPLLGDHGYSETDTIAILGGNWRRHLENNLPE